MVRYATADDHGAIAGVTEAAFARPDEARLVERLRADEDAMFELVAEADGAVVGHILFSRLWADRDDLYAALAPVSVAPGRQGTGLGSALVRAGLERAPQFGAIGVLVLGEPAYYGRFGFTRQAALAVRSPFSALEAFQALALFDGAFEAPMTVAYPAAFGS